MAASQLAQLPHGVVPKSALQDNISRIKPQTWAYQSGTCQGRRWPLAWECNRQVRMNSTVVATNIHEPSTASVV